MSGFAFTLNEEVLSFTASGDLSLCQNRLVDLIVNADLIVGLAPAAGGYGVLLNAPKDGQPASVVVGGITMVRVGAAVQAGNDLTSAASGWAVADVSGTSERVIGRALTGAASGSLASVHVRQFYHPNSVGA
jgi:hypothetical protein